MESILMSVRPKWCELIASGKKTIEIRKTKPKYDVPFKVYIYCTKGVRFSKNYYQNDKLIYSNKLNGKVIGEFICDKIFNYTTSNCKDGVTISDMDITKKSCLSYKEICNYENNFSCSENQICYFGLFCYHISNLKIYNKPKELAEFGLKRPPQSWCYGAMLMR